MNIIQRLMRRALAGGMLSLTIVAFDPTQLLPIYGGSGGNAFSRDCGAGMVLTGLRGRTGVFIDAVGMLCRPVNANGTLGAETTVGSMAGGGGGNNFIAHGKPGEVVFGARIYSGMYVDAMSLHCQTWDPATRKVFSSGSFVDFGHGGAGTEKTEHCALNKQPVSGIRGRASAVVDAIGLKCDEP